MYIYVYIYKYIYTYKYHMCIYTFVRVAEGATLLDRLEDTRYTRYTHDMSVSIGRCQWSTHCNTLQHTATHCNTLQHTATHDISVSIGLYHFKARQPSLFICV